LRYTLWAGDELWKNLLNNHKHGIGDVKEKMFEVTEEARLFCFSCGICIGPGYGEPFPFYAGDKKICGRCRGKLTTQGYIQLNQSQRLLPDGKVIKFRLRLHEELG